MERPADVEQAREAEAEREGNKVIADSWMVK